jgi:hypothetical protein
MVDVRSIWQDYMRNGTPIFVLAELLQPYLLAKTKEEVACLARVPNA